MATHSTAVGDSELETLPSFLERHWDALLAGRELRASLDDVEDPEARFEWFEWCGDYGIAGVRRYVMRLRDGSRIRADVDEGRGTVRFVRVPAGAGVQGWVRFVREVLAARQAPAWAATRRMGDAAHSPSMASS